MSTEDKILGVRVDPTSYQAAATLCIEWAKKHESRTVCVANVHVIMEAHDSAAFKEVVNGADLVTPDGMPLVWTMRRLGHPQQERVYGPELTLQLIDCAEQANLPVGFYGSAQGTLQRLLDGLKHRNPELEINYAYSPPFRELTVDEDEAVIQEINASGTRFLFVGLGCPKQERWLAEHKGRIQAVMLGVGAAFDFIAGVKSQAPRWMRENGLEWVYRLTHEPRRLWRRYFYHNPRFIILVTKQLLHRGE
jgi:N-acetylglucosaminyldiphosphoundecaprenol N-acetyl-beta-D-mannosaminyltransferase